MTKSIGLSGARYGVPANSGIRSTSLDLEWETVVTGELSLAKESDVVIDGITFTGNAYLILNESSSVTIRNCRFFGVTPNTAKSFLFKDTSNNEEKSTLVTIENCYFGDYVKSGSNVMYNLFEFNNNLMTGSVVRNNYFSRDCCTHNIVNIYRVDENVIIDVTDNVFEMSRNAVHIGVIGDKACVVNIKNNTYKETDNIHPDYAGILIVQPYEPGTVDMSKWVINIDNTKKPVGQLYYMYPMVQFTKTNRPTINVNGVCEVTPEPISK